MKKNIKKYKDEIELMLFDIRENISYEMKEPNSDLLFNDDDLAGFCANASYLIYNILKNNGFNLTIAVNDEHAFVKCEEYVLDITVSQFNNIYGTNISEVFTKKHIDAIGIFDCWQIQEEFDDLNNFEKYLDKTGWIPVQNPFLLKETSKSF